MNRSLVARIAGIVERIVSDLPEIQEICVRSGEQLRSAICYPQITGRAEIGDRVILNTWAVSLELGTGGYDFVVSIDREPEPQDCSGHIVKLRYTPLQFPILAAEEPDSPQHEAIANFRSLDGIPVVCAELHSQVAPIAGAVHWETRGRARVVYVMTDGAALPIAFSKTVSELKNRGLIRATVTAGQSYGGDFEAVNLYSGLAAARVSAGADIIIVCQGPGSTGTATPLGFTGIDQGIALNAATSLGGTAICAVRMSFADSRPRHRGFSHHTLTVLERVVLTSVLVPVPKLPREQHFQLRGSLESTGLLDRYEFITVEADTALAALDEAEIPMRTMGRNSVEEREFFLSAVAAGLLAGQWSTDPLSITNRDKELPDGD